MEHTFIIISCTVAIYAALFVYVAFSPKLSKKLIATAGIISVVCGLIFYGICFASICDSLILAILKTCQAVCLLFVGESSKDAIADAPMMQYLIVQIFFSILSFLGIFTTAGAAVSAIGANFLRKIRVYLQQNRDVAVIQPLNPKTLEFTRKLVAKKKVMVVFADENPDASCTDAAQELGCVIRSDDDAISGSENFLRSIGIGKTSRKLALYVLSDDRFANRRYACKLTESLCKRNVDPRLTSLTIFANEGDIHNSITSQDGTYSFGSILCISQEQMAARMLMHKAPLWETISFDENGRATEDFHALVVGSGNVGQAVIKQIVMNGQFAGSHFALTIFDPKFPAVTGQLHHESRQIFQQYDIRAYNEDARSCRMFDFLEEELHKLKYIVVCTGNDSVNREVARQLSRFLTAAGSSLPIYICSSRGLQRITATDITRWDIFTPQVLCSDDMDKLAMLLNHSYCGNDKTPRENWDDCDYFSRMSSRASADYAPAFLKMAGLPADAIPEEDWYTPQQLENMAISEHERWCAFHFCMGFRAMTEEEYAQRCHIYKEEKAKNPASRYRIGKDVAKRIHSCLIPWEELDNLSARENAVTGGSVDYKQMDRNNVLTLPALLKSAKE